jgi:hypothetical protein
VSNKKADFNTSFQFYIDCEEAYKQCLWLENRGYRAKGHDSSAQTPKTVASIGTFGVFAK